MAKAPFPPKAAAPCQPPGLIPDLAAPVQTLTKQVQLLTQTMGKGAGKASSSRGWTHQFTGAAPIQGPPGNLNWHGQVPPMEHPVNDWGGSTQLLHLEGGEDSFGRMARGSAGMAEIVWNREVNPWEKCRELRGLLPPTGGGDVRGTELLQRDGHRTQTLRKPRGAPSDVAEVDHDCRTRLRALETTCGRSYSCTGLPGGGGMRTWRRPT